MNVALRESYARCRQMARRAASNFYYSFYLLPRGQRRSMYALYAFLRKTDDLGDSERSADVRRRSLVRWRAALEAALHVEGRPFTRADDPGE